MDNRNPQYDVRLYERLPVGVPGEIFIRGEDHSTSCIVINLSGSGARIRTTYRSSICSPVVLYVEGFGRFDSVTTPNDGDFIGVIFVLGPEQMKAHMEKLADYRFRGKAASSRLRRYPRTRVGGVGHFRRRTGQTGACEMLDVSLHGASLKTEMRPPVGEIVAFGSTKARVVRHHEAGIGVFFLELQVK